MAKRLQILSLGAGIQSSTLLLMSIRGVLPRLHCAIFSDPGFEGAATHEHLKWLKTESEAAGIPVHTVSNGNIVDHLIDGHAAGKRRYASLPLHILTSDNERAKIPRQCTREFKIIPITQFIRREILGLRPRQRFPKTPVIDQWMGISSDEGHRMRDPAPNEQWKRHIYPLCGVPGLMLGRTYSRAACVAWLAKNYPDRTTMPASSCVICPFHSNARWRFIRDNEPAEWQRACEIDAAIRHGHKMDGTAYLHRDCVPLADATLEDTDQMDLGFGEECLGLCGN
jgi:hypothetical protein